MATELCCTHCRINCDMCNVKNEDFKAGQTYKTYNGIKQTLLYEMNGKEPTLYFLDENGYGHWYCKNGIRMRNDNRELDIKIVEVKNG